MLSDRKIRRLDALRLILDIALVLVTMLTFSSCAQQTREAANNEQLPHTYHLEPPPKTSPAWQVIGASVQGRPLRVRTLGDGKRTVVLIGGIHGDEPEGAYATDELPKVFAESDLAQRVTLKILEDANPDGRALQTRQNANGIDINRNFPASNFDASSPENGGAPLTQPESRAVHDFLEGVRPDLVVVFHSWVDRQFINFDGPALGLAERFSAISGLPVQESQSFGATPGSIGSFFGRDRGVPVLTIELRKGSDPKADWDLIQSALLAIVRG